MRPELRIYKAFYEAKRRAYFSELKRLTGMSLSSLQNALKRMEKEWEIEKISTKGNTFYKIISARKAALMFSLLTLERFNSLSLQVKNPLESFIDLAPDVHSIVLFGSASRNEARKGSDIDLLIIFNDVPEDKGKHPDNMRKIFRKIKKEIDTQSIYPLSLSFISKKDMDSKDHLIRQAIETGFPIKNQQAYYETERILTEYGIIGYRDIQGETKYP